jgi:site-specific recombinase XerD
MNRTDGRPNGRTRSSIGLTNDELVDAYKTFKRPVWRSAATRTQRRSVLGSMSWAVPDLYTATTDQLLDWVDALNRKSPNTVHAYLATCRGFYEWLQLDAKLRPDNPAARIRGPRVPKTKPRPILPKNYTTALASAAVVDIEMYLWLLLAGCGGFRCCEIAWLTISMVEEQADGSALAHIRGKGGKWRTVPIGQGLMATLKPFLKGVGKDPVFTRPTDGKAHTPNAVSGRINRFLHEMGIVETAHQLRHRFGTDYYVVDGDLLRQAEIMGHENVEQTRGYTELESPVAIAAIEQLTKKWMQPQHDQAA